MKMDIEGAETTVLPHLLKTAAARNVRALYVEWHSNYLLPKEKYRTGLREIRQKEALSLITTVRKWH